MGVVLLGAAAALGVDSRLAMADVDDGRARWPALGAVASAAGVALSWFCCLPVAAGIGAGLAAVGSTLLPFQPLLALASLAFLGFAFVRSRRSVALGASCSIEGASRRRWLLAMATLLTLGLLASPFLNGLWLYWGP